MYGRNEGEQSLSISYRIARNYGSELMQLGKTSYVAVFCPLRMEPAATVPISNTRTMVP